MRSSFAALVLFSVAVFSEASAQDFRLFPTNPAAGEEFVVQFIGGTSSSPATLQRTEVAISGSTITITAIVDEGDFSAVWVVRVGSVVTAPQPGTYQIVGQIRSNAATYSPTTLGSVTVGAARAVSTPQYRNLSGLWWAPDESGWGLNVTQGDSGNIFAVWYTYEPSGSASRNMWLSMPSGKWISPTEIRGVLYEATGTGLNLPFNASATRLFPAGIAILRASSPDALVLDAQGAVGMERLGFGATTAVINKTKVLQRFVF